MDNFNNDIFLDRFPKIDLHGCDREMSRVMVNDFLDEARVMKYSKVVIIHGIGKGVVKQAVHEVLLKRKDIFRYYVVSNNIGCTVVELIK